MFEEHLEMKFSKLNRKDWHFEILAKSLYSPIPFYSHHLVSLCSLYYLDQLFKCFQPALHLLTNFSLINSLTNLNCKAFCNGSFNLYS